MKSNSFFLMLSVSGLCLGLSYGAPAVIADEVHECNGVFTTLPCDQVPTNETPGVSVVPGRNLSTGAAINMDQGNSPQLQQQQQQQQQQANPNNGNNAVEVDEDGDDGDGYYDGNANNRRAYEAGRAVQNRREENTGEAPPQRVFRGRR